MLSQPVCIVLPSRLYYYYYVVIRSLELTRVSDEIVTESDLAMDTELEENITNNRDSHSKHLINI